jgi:hypothetical protein
MAVGPVHHRGNAYPMISCNQRLSNKLGHLWNLNIRRFWHFERDVVPN